MLEATASLWHSARAVVRDSTELIGLELRHAGLSLAVIVGLGVVIGLLMASLWFLGLAALMVWLVDSGTASWPATLLLAAMVNVILGVILVFVAKSFAKGLLFEASRRQLFGGTSNHLVPAATPSAGATSE